MNKVNASSDWAPETFLIKLRDILRDYSVSINQGADGRLFKTVSVTGAYSASENDHVILVAPSGTCTITLPAASQMQEKRILVKRSNNTTHTITIQASSGNIDGAASVTLTTAWQSREFLSDGTNYFEVT